MPSASLPGHLAAFVTLDLEARIHQNANVRGSSHLGWIYVCHYVARHNDEEKLSLI